MGDFIQHDYPIWGQRLSTRVLQQECALLCIRVGHFARIFALYRGTSLMINRPPLGPYNRPTLMAAQQS